MKPTSINWKVKSLVCTQERFLVLVITLISDYCLENRFTLIYKNAFSLSENAFLNCYVNKFYSATFSFLLTRCLCQSKIIATTALATFVFFNRGPWEYEPMKLR